MWPLLGLQWHFAFSDLNAGGEGEWIALFLHLFLGHFACCYMGLKGIIKGLQDLFLVCKCGHYWPSNISLPMSFDILRLMKEGRGSELHYFCTYFLVLLCVLTLV